MRFTYRLHVFLFLLWLLPVLCLAQVRYGGDLTLDLLYGEGFGQENSNLATLTVGHNGNFGAFEQYGFVDLYQDVQNRDLTAHLEWYPKISLRRATGETEESGIVDDVLLGGGINADFGGDNNPFVFLAGPVWKFNLPGFESFQLETYYYRPVHEEGFTGTYHITPSWNLIIPVTRPLILRLTGFADFIGDYGTGVPQIITQPQLLFDLGNFWGEPGRFYVGTEWYYQHNSGGVEGRTVSVFQLDLRVEL